MKILAIETSCDDTSLSIVSDDQGIFEVEELIAYSQIQDHQQFGGVVPEIASRLHSEKILALLQVLKVWERVDIDAIAVTSYPGLPGSLVVGKTVAYQLWAFLQKPVLAINHIWGHVFSIFLERNLDAIQFPFVILTASGGHNDLYVVNKKDQKITTLADLGYEVFSFADFSIHKIGWTLDDAAGESFDKASRMLGGPYPGGAWIGQQAEKGKPNPLVQFKRIFLAHEQFEFSFSGMKSQVSFLLKKLEQDQIALSEQLIADIAYEFQEAVVEVLAKKLVQAAKDFKIPSIALAGGVSANKRLKAYLADLAKKEGLEFHFPAKNVYSTDNGAMIALVGLLESYSWA